MRDQLLALAKLFEIDERARDLDAELKELPEHLNELRADVQRLEGMLGKERDELRDAEALRDNQQVDLADRNETLSRAKAKAAKAKNLKEVQAVERELEANRRMIKEREDEILKLEEAIEKNRATITNHEKEFEELRQIFAEEETKARARIEELQGERAKVLSGREVHAGKLESITLRRYERVREAKGAGVSVIPDPMCRSCRRTLSPQLYIELQRGTELHQCPFCLVFLVYKAFAED